MTDRNYDQFMTEFLNLARRPAINFFHLAKIITKLHRVDPLCMLIMVKKTRISKRRLYYYLDVGRLLNEHNVRQAEAEALGWTKLQIIARHVKYNESASASDISKFLALASNSTVLMLKQNLRGYGAIKLHSVVLQLSPEHRKELDCALVSFGAKKTFRGLAEKEAALIRMVRASRLQRE